MKIDLHMHTTGSDGHGTSKEIVDAAIAAGLDGIAITDHHRTFTDAGDEVAKLAAESGLVVIRGAEYSTDRGHLLVFLPEDMGIEDFDVGFYPDAQALIDAMVDAGGACIPAHPYKGYQRAWKSTRKLHRIAGVETRNGHVAHDNPKQNQDAEKDAKASRRHGTGGSDAHWPGEIGVCFTEFQTKFKDQAGFLRALKSGRFEACTNEELLKKQKRFQSKLPKVTTWRNDDSYWYQPSLDWGNLDREPMDLTLPSIDDEIDWREEKRRHDRERKDARKDKRQFHTLQEFDSFLINRKLRD